MGNLFWPHKVIIYQQNLEVLYILQADQVPGQEAFLLYLSGSYGLLCSEIHSHIV